MLRGVEVRHLGFVLKDAGERVFRDSTEAWSIRPILRAKGSRKYYAFPCLVSYSRLMVAINMYWSFGILDKLKRDQSQNMKGYSTGAGRAGACERQCEAF